MKKTYKYTYITDEKGAKVYLIAEVELGSTPGTHTVATAKTEEDAQTIVDALNATVGEKMERMLNVMGGRDACKEFVEHMLTMHRTLNQKFAGSVVIPFVRAMASRYKEERYDGRNELAARYCSLLWKGLVDEYPHLDNDNWELPLI